MENENNQPISKSTLSPPSYNDSKQSDEEMFN